MSSLDLFHSNSAYFLYSAVWYAYGTISIETIRLQSFAAGTRISSRLAIIPGWNMIVEPMIISQLARIFVGMHSFVQGLTSDNTNLVEIERALRDMRNVITEDLQDKK
jgi:hypothetical protein